MNMKLTRRQFGQLAIASTATIAVGALVSQAVAQTPPSSVLMGVRVGAIIGIDPSVIPEINSTDITKVIPSINTTVTSLTQQIVVESLNVGSLEMKTQFITPGILLPSEQLSGAAALNGTPVVAATNISTGSMRLIFLSTSPKTQTVSGLKSNDTLLDLQVLKDGSLIGMVSNNNSTPPFRLVNINPQTGEITDNNTLAENQRITNITQCPDGNLYGIAVKPNGETDLIGIENGQTTSLRFNDQLWTSGLSDLVCSPSNQLFALGSGRYELTKYLHTIDQKTGVLTRLKEFNVARITM
ncbi:MAG: hypothetical protein DSM106950_06610 [Stigonema ocellatum SAG 48.90 = DSM 106950]|nr:hypothetical protein [Stigonema ocellatum SAG 48.90 = DSM 106950]